MLGKLTFFAFVFSVTLGRISTYLVKTTGGIIMGKPSPRAVSYLGVPFADPPRRWEPPHQKRPWTGVWDATYLRHMCLQKPCKEVEEADICTARMSENCLYLNVFTPRDARPGSNKAVMIFIHGGSFESYTGSGRLFDGEVFTAKSDVILVAINYRLGVLGSLTFRGREQMGNYGIQDQILALRWIYFNIFNFGGDPNRITLFGHSAGGMSVVVHLINRETENYFQRAIIQSAPFGIPLKTVQQALTQTQEFSQQLNCLPNDINCLRSKSSQEVIAAQMAVPSSTLAPEQKILPWMPCVNGNDVQFDLLTASRIARISRKPIIIGTTTDEGIAQVYTLFQQPLDYRSYVRYLTLTTREQAPSLVQLYYPQNPRDARLELARLMCDRGYTCPNRRFVNDLSKTNANVWHYVFDYGLRFLEQTNILRMCQRRSCHGNELPYLFQTVDKIGFRLTPAEQRLSDLLLVYWTNFAKTGDPNLYVTSPLIPRWPLYRNSRRYLYVTLPESRIGQNYGSQTCNILERLMFSTQ